MDESFPSLICWNVECFSLVCGSIYSIQLLPVCFQCPSQSTEGLEDMVVLLFTETWLSVIHINPWPALPSRVVMKICWSLPFPASPLDHCHCGCGQLTGGVCSSTAFPHVWMKFLTGTLAIKPCFKTMLVLSSGLCFGIFWFQILWFVPSSSLVWPHSWPCLEQVVGGEIMIQFGVPSKPNYALSLFFGSSPHLKTENNVWKPKCSNLAKFQKSLFYCKYVSR